MSERSKMNFWDAGNKFSAVKEEARNAFTDDNELTIYSLTPEGETQPTRLIIKMTPKNDGNNYLSLKRLDVPEAAVYMVSLDYQAFSPEELRKKCLDMCRKMYYNRAMMAKPVYVNFEKQYEGGRMEKTTYKNFFRFNPRSDEPGAQDFLRDKEFFYSFLDDPDRPNLSGLPLLRDDQKKTVTAIDLSRADVSGRRDLSRLFMGYEKVTELDLSAFDTSCATNMGDMFRNCRSLRRLDLSGFDFSNVNNMSGIFGLCPSLESVIVSDTILQVSGIPHTGGRYVKEWSSSWGGAHTPSQADFAGTLCEDWVWVSEKTKVRFAEATKEEQYEYLGLTDNCKRVPTAELIIVPHKPFAKGRK